MAIVFLGLGNPESEYKGTRHNIGFDFLNFLQEKQGTRWEKKKNFFFSHLTHPSAILVKPDFYMNESGKALKTLRKEMAYSQMIVLLDQMDLDLGKIRLKKKGGDAGHRGLRSILEHAQEDFWVLYFGIGRPEFKGRAVVDYVLEKFSSFERETVKKTFESLSSFLSSQREKIDWESLQRKINGFL